MKPAHDEDERGGLFAMTVARPVALMVAFVTLIVLGIIAYARIPVQLLPSDYAAPWVWMWIPNPGASAQENEERVARVVEEQLRTLTGIEEMTSYSREGMVQIGVEFDGTMDLDLAKAELRDRIERARPNLPPSVMNIGVWSEDASQLPLTVFGIQLRGDEDRRDHLMENVVIPKLEAVQGIGRVDIWGVLQDSVRILLDEDAVAAAQLDLGSIIQRLSTDNFALPMGEVNDGGREVILRSDMRFKSLEEIERFPIGNGLTLADVGRVAAVKSVSNSLSRIDGAYAYYGSASKDSQANVVEASHAFQEALDELREDPRLGGDFDALVFFMQGDMIESALSQLEQTALWGGALAVLVLFVFLRRVRLTLCVALSIPVSVLLAIVWQYFSGDSFNLLTMVGITLGIGMLVDNAVVVVENIARMKEEGVDSRTAAVRGTRQIALAVTLATLTTVVVFLPIIFMTDNPMVRVMFGGMGIPLSVSLVASLLVAVVFLPVITARILGDRPAAAGRVARRLAPLTTLPVRLVAWIVGALRAAWFVLLRTVHHVNRLALAVLTPLRWPLALGVVALVAWRWEPLTRAFEAGGSLSAFDVAVGVPPEQVSVTLVRVLVVPGVVALALALLGLKRWRRRPALPPRRREHFVPRGDSLVGMIVSWNHDLVAWTLRHRLAACGLALLALLSIYVPSSQMVVTPFGQEDDDGSVSFRIEFETEFTLAEAGEEVGIYEDFLESRKDDYGFDHWSTRFDERGGRLALYFEERRPTAETKALKARLREDVPRVPGHRLLFYDGNDSQGGSRAVVSFRLLGPDSGELERLATQAVAILEDVPGLSDLSTPLENAPDQIRVEVDRDVAHELGVTTEALQNTISYALRGWSLPRYQDEGRELPFVIEFDEENVAGLPTLRDLSVYTPSRVVPLASFASMEFTKGHRAIFRRNGQTSFTIEARIEDPLQIVPLTQAAARALNERLDFPRGYSLDTENSAFQRQEEEFAELFRAMALSIVLVFLLMGILFESVLLPFSVLFTIPFAVMGSYWTLFLSGTPMDSVGWIGMIILSGVVVNNGIVLIDRIHRLRGPGVVRAEAVVRGCGERVRPVLMTALTTICGLLPMIVSEPPSGNSIDYRALGTVVAGGLAASTFFTLWVVPLAYTIIDDLAALVRSRFAWWTRPPSRRGRDERNAWWSDEAVPELPALKDVAPFPRP